jgi:hypothetical protein
MVAPQTPGTYNAQYQMVWEGQKLFGEILSKTVTVTSPDVAAQVISDNIPTTMIGGHSYSVTVTMKNTGTKTWTETDLIRLAGIGDGTTFAPVPAYARAFIPAGTSVTPQNSYDFSFPMVAPQTPGTYNAQYQMVWEGQKLFGEILSKTVTVGIVSIRSVNQ